jgi:ribosomal protein L11 methylase PrmA
MLRQLRRWIARLEPADTGRTVWGDYARTHSYSATGEVAKRAFVARFVGAVRPGPLVDLGCNTGEYGAAALAAGAGGVVGFDFDQRALEAAYARAAAEGLNLLPLVLDAANPSPDQGWHQAERPGFGRRVAGRADAVLALAFEHHLAIGRNVPLDHFLAWLTGLAPCGVVEFVPKHDPTVQRMLALREDIFADYDEASFRTLLGRRARIVEEATVSETGRRLLWYETHTDRSLPLAARGMGR